MRYSVTWHPDAERELGDVWLSAPDRQAVTRAADLIDRLLSSDPLAQGEEFYGDRLLVELPLAITYTVSESDCCVQILQVWHQ